MKKETMRRALILAAVLLGIYAALIAMFALVAASDARALLDSLDDPTAPHADLASAAADSLARVGGLTRIPALVSLGIGGDVCAVGKLALAVEAVGYAAKPLAPLVEGLAVTADFPAESTDLAAWLALPDCAGVSAEMAAWIDGARGAMVTLDLLHAVAPRLTEGARALILLQNSDELRPAGGFITAVVELRVENGAISARVLNSYSIDDGLTGDAVAAIFRRPPLPLERYMALERWLFRDANWSPDWATSAQTAAQMYTTDTGEPAPILVAAVNLSAVQTFADLMPPLMIDGAPFESANALDRVRALWEGDAPDYNSDAPERKAFIAEFAAQALGAAREQYGLRDQLRALGTLETMLDRRDILLWSPDPELQFVFRLRGWDGALPDAPRDSLVVSDANIGYNKISPLVARELIYSADLAAGTAEAALTLTNTTSAPADCTAYDPRQDPRIAPTYAERQQGCSWHYVRVYPASGASLADYTAHTYPRRWFEYSQAGRAARVDAVQDAERTGWGMVAVVPPGESVTLRWMFALPERVIEPRAYALLIPRQPGAPPVKLTVRVTLPLDAVFLSASQPYTQDSRTLTFEAVPDADWMIEVRWR